jgi:hypothetical protein
VKTVQASEELFIARGFRNAATFEVAIALSTSGHVAPVQREVGQGTRRSPCPSATRPSKSGQLKPGQTVIETISGNMASVSHGVRPEGGYPLVITMAETFSIERRKLMEGCRARQDARLFLTRQFENETNLGLAHLSASRDYDTGKSA